MNEYVKIIIKDNDGKVSQHHYLRAEKWGLPSGRIEAEEKPIQAAARELLERTGYSIDPKDLKLNKKFLDKDKDQIYVFFSHIDNVVKSQPPQIEIRWKKV